MKANERKDKMEKPAMYERFEMIEKLTQGIEKRAARNYPTCKDAAAYGSLSGFMAGVCAQYLEAEGWEMIKNKIAENAAL